MDVSLFAVEGCRYPEMIGEVYLMSFVSVPNVSNSEISAKAALHALFSTISHNLEPEGWGTRFPILFNQIYAGKLYLMNAKEALEELQLVRHELKSVSTESIIWCIHNPEKCVPYSYGYNRQAKSCADWFLTTAGRDFLLEIEDSLHAFCEFPESSTAISYRFPLDVFNE